MKLVMETNLRVIYKYFQDFLVKMFSASYYMNKQAHIRFFFRTNKQETQYNIHTIIILINKTNVTITTTLSA